MWTGRAQLSGSGRLRVFLELSCLQVSINVSEFTLIAERESVKESHKHTISICPTFLDKNLLYLQYLRTDLYSL